MARFLEACNSRDNIPDSEMGVPGKNKYPLDTQKHIKSAAHLINHGHITYDERESLAKKILRRAHEEGMSTDGMDAVKQIAAKQEQVPPMSDGTSIGNSPPRLMAPYYDESNEQLAQRLSVASGQAASSVSTTTEEDELLSRVRKMAVAHNLQKDPILFAKRIVDEISTKSDNDAKPPTGNQNCQLCTWCAEARYRGINALPRPVYSPRDPVLNIPGETIVRNPIREKFTSQRDVIEKVRGAVDSRWYIHVNWKDSTGGHEFLVVNIQDYAYILDAQAGLLKEIDETDSSHSYFRDINTANSFMVRLDTREFNRELLDEATDMSKVLPWKNSLDIPYMRDRGMLSPGDDDDPRFRRVLVPSEEGLKYLKEDPELSQYWEDMHKATNGEFLVDRETGEAIGHAFVHTSKKNKGFIFNIEVTPSYRRQGYGWILIDDAVRRFGGEDLTVRCDNEPAVHLYLDYGFEIYKKGVWYDPPHEEYWMKYDRAKLNQPVQEGVINNLRNMTLLPVKDFKYNKVFYGDPIDGGSVRKLDGKPLFVTPHAGIASIFVGRRNIFHKLSEMGYTQVNLGYDEWGSAPDKPLTDVHVYVRNAPDLKPFKIEFDGYLHTIDCSKLKDNIYHYPWMQSTEHEVLIAKVPEVKIDKVQKMHITYHVRGIKGNSVQESAIQEAACTASLLTVKNQLTQILGGNYEFIGGSLVPRFIVKSKEKPSLSFQIDVNGANIEVTPLYNDLPDFIHKRRGIAFMQAANVVARFIEDMTRDYKPPVKEYAVQEEFSGKNSYSGEINQLLTRIKKYEDRLQSENNAENADKIRIHLAGLYIDLIKTVDYAAHDTHIDDTELNELCDLGNDTVKKYVQLIPDIKNPTYGMIVYQYAIVAQVDWVELRKFINKPGKYSDFLTEWLYLRATGSSKEPTNDKLPTFKGCKEIAQFIKGEITYEEASRKCDEYVTEAILSIVNDILRKKSKPVQEGAFQDLKNGVNPFSDDLVFHVSPDKHIDGQVWKPRVPDYLDPYNPDETGFEDNTTGRICFSTSIEGALNGITVNLPRQNPDQFDKLYVYIPEKPWKKYKHKTTKELVKGKLVYDANVTREVWIMEPVRMKLYGVIRVDQVSNAKRKAVVPTASGKKDTRNYFTYKWHWVVKPRVLNKATKFDYSPERVIDDLCIDIKKFKYGLIRDGKVNTSASEKEYEKYWVFHTGEEVDQAGGGLCYDMVEYEAGYLEAFGVPYKKYFMSSTRPGDENAETHTFVVVPLDGKFIYIEQAFKRVVDEWGHDRQKSFDKLSDLFDYVAECSADFYNSDLNFGVWDYTDEQFSAGTPLHDFQNWIYKKCKMIYDGEVSNPNK